MPPSAVPRTKRMPMDEDTFCMPYRSLLHWKFIPPAPWECL
jgi:hypothetical protein